MTAFYPSKDMNVTIFMDHVILFTSTQAWPQSELVFERVGLAFKRDQFAGQGAGIARW